MKSTHLLVGAAAVTAFALTACGGGHSEGSSTSTTTSTTTMASAQSLDTAEVLTQARATSETTYPYQVDDGALTLTDTSETGKPIGVGSP